MKSKVSCYSRLEQECKGLELCKYPENEAMPADQVIVANKLVEESARTGKPFAVLTVSPYVLKAIAVRCDLLEQEVEFIGADGRPVEFEYLFKCFAEPFAKLVHGDSFHFKGA